MNKRQIPIWPPRDFRRRPNSCQEAKIKPVYFVLLGAFLGGQMRHKEARNSKIGPPTDQLCNLLYLVGYSLQDST